MKKIIGIGCCFCLLSWGIQAQDYQKTLTLEGTIRIAQDSSLQAYIAKNTYLSNYWAFRSYKAGRLPAIDLNMTPINYNRDYTKRYDSQQNIDVYRQQQSLFSSGGLQMSQNVDFTGGTVFLESDLAFTRNFASDQTYSQYSSIPIRIGYSQNLLGFNQFKWDRKVEPLKYEKAKKQFLFDQQVISETSTQYFFDLAMAQTMYDVALMNYASSDTLYAIGQERHKIAGITQSDLMILRLDAINAKNSLKNAHIALKRAMASFVSFLNLDKQTQVRVQLPDIPKSFTISADLALQYAQENNPDYQAFEQQKLESQELVEQAVKSSKFNATFSASVGFNQVADNFSGAYHKPSQQNVVAVHLNIPLVDWGVRKGKVNVAKSNLNITQSSVKQKEVSLEQDVMMTVNDFNVQQDMISSAEEAKQLAEDAYNITKQRFIIGKADINSLTLSQSRQNEAQKNYILALQSYWLSYYKIQKITLYNFQEQTPLRLITKD